MPQHRYDPELLRKLAGKLRKQEEYIREQISKRAANHIVSPEAYFVHWLMNEKIGAEKYRRPLSQEIKQEIRDLRKEAEPAKKNTLRVSRKGTTCLQVKELTIGPKDPFLPRSLIRAAHGNAEVYPALFLFENSLRNFIEVQLSSKYRSNWWEKRVRKETRNKVEGRIRKEEMNKWHGGRGAIHPIFYTDFSDLSNILKANVNIFGPLFKETTGGLNWLTQKLDELYLSRNNIAHSAPLKGEDRKRLLLYFRDWYRQLDTLSEQE